MKLTRNSLKELIRQSIKEMDFKNQKAFDAYNKKHKMRKSTKVNIGGKETTAGDAEGGGAKGAPKPGSSASPDDVMNATLGGEKIGDIIDNEDHPNYLKAINYVISFDPDDEKVVSGPGQKEGVRESVSRKRTTVKEVKTWMRTLEENRYKKTYQSDCRRVAWLVNNNLSEDYESMPISMRKKWSKAAYGRERQLATEFLKHKRNEAKLKESIRKIVTRLIND